MTPGRTLIYALAIGAMLVGWNGAFPLDDSYTVLHSARALLSGNFDHAYATSPLTGATSSVHLALVAALGLALPLPSASIAINALAALAYALGLDRLVRQAGARGWQVPVLALLGLGAGSTPINLFNGLETGLAMATVAWLLALADDRRLPCLAGIAPFVRPELGVLSAALLARRIWLQGQAGQTAALALAGALPWLAWMLVETGAPFPATAEAKMAFFAEWATPLPIRLWTALAALATSALLPFHAGLLGIGRVRAGWCGALFVVAVLAVAALTLPSSLAWNYHRYLAVTVPVAIHGLAGFSRERIAPWAYGVLAAYALVNAPRAAIRLHRDQAGEARNLAAIAAAASRIAPGATILTHDAGMIAWSHPEVRLVDAVGLKTPSSIAFHRRFTRASCRWERALDGIARRGGARYALLLQAPFWSCVGTSLDRAGWRLDPLAEAGPYRLYHLTAPHDANDQRDHRQDAK